MTSARKVQEHVDPSRVTLFDVDVVDERDRASYLLIEMDV